MSNERMSSLFRSYRERVYKYVRLKKVSSWIKQKGKIAIKFLSNVFSKHKASDELELSSFIIGPTVGTGSYATVCLAALKGDVFAQDDDVSPLLHGETSSNEWDDPMNNGNLGHHYGHHNDHHGHLPGLAINSPLVQEWQSVESNGLDDHRNGNCTKVNVTSETMESLSTKPFLTCALKILHKRKVVNNRQTKHLLNEKRILETINHPFIVHYLGSFQDPINVYLILEYVPGGELFTYLRRSTLDLYTTQFYASEILSALDFLHSRSIVYRDLKPENILLDAQGHIRLVDFGFAKKIRGKTYTICGTHEYLAPEIFLRKGHDKCVDLWSFGVLIYEMLVGEAPFYDKDPQKTYRKALENKMYFPPQIGESARSIIEALLRVDPTQRIGSKDMKELWSHTFFKGARFFGDVAPIKPIINGTWDTSNFLDYPEVWTRYRERVSKMEQERFFAQF